MRQLKTYKKALEVLEKADITTNKKGHVFWVFDIYYAGALCYLIRDISKNSTVITQFRRDSEIVLGRELYEDDLWFTNINKDEPKARAERIEHLENLIKLYDDE